MNFEEAMKGLEGVVIDLSEMPFTAFEVWFEDQGFYTNMRFIHGDKLFDRDGDGYRVLPVQMAYQAWSYQKAQLNNMEVCYIQVKKERDEAVYLKNEHRVARVRLSRERDILQKQIEKGCEKIDQFWKEGCLFPEWLDWAKKALRGDHVHSN